MLAGAPSRLVGGGSSTGSPLSPMEHPISGGRKQLLSATHSCIYSIYCRRYQRAQDLIHGPGHRWHLKPRPCLTPSAASQHLRRTGPTSQVCTHAYINLSVLDGLTTRQRHSIQRIAKLYWTGQITSSCELTITYSTPKF